MPFTRVLLVSHDQDASSFSFTSYPFALKLFAIIVGKLAVALLAIFGIPAFIDGSIFPLVYTKTMLFAINKSSLVDFAIFVLHDTFSRCQIVVRKLSFILPIISFVFTSSMLFACHIFSIVN